MTRRFLLVAIAALSMLAAAGVAYGAGKATKHKVSSVGAQRPLSDSNGHSLLAGRITNQDYGEGATVARVAASTTDSDNLTVTATAYYKAGSITVKGPTVATPERDGSATFNGTLKAVSGTGVFKGVKGSLIYKGAQTAADPTLINYTLKGTLTY
jgi:hypothetical protein